MPGKIPSYKVTEHQTGGLSMEDEKILQLYFARDEEALR